ncbi:hypothetical protein K2173_028264 [Erythroxylum novogranatense]|uniref:Germin-like protein n=1 Tax=Erythroxylum novogranatense TaxID=1862640 RepID=A0AAV8U1C5_9ROSI|nr:hypothetical protein K2173_028264 [Erythroxylum novogranatense]
MEKVARFIVSTLIVAAIVHAVLVRAGDPDILKDILVPPSIDPNNITRQYLTYTGFRLLRKANVTGKTTALIAKASVKEFPALEGQGISASMIIYPPSGINPPHIHQRASELLMVLHGELEVGFIDSSNKLYKQTLQSSDLFIFPKGLVHYQINTKSDYPSYAVAMFGSASAGTISLPKTLFGTGISPDILSKAFKVDGDTISKLIRGTQ